MCGLLLWEETHTERSFSYYLHGFSHFFFFHITSMLLQLLLVFSRFLTATVLNLHRAIRKLQEAAAAAHLWLKKIRAFIITSTAHCHERPQGWLGQGENRLNRKIGSIMATSEVANRTDHTNMVNRNDWNLKVITCGLCSDCSSPFKRTDPDNGDNTTNN